MGIRFRCPNGHKVHVKAFLAGKMGICPHCQAKMVIPEHSDPELSAEERSDEGGADRGPLDSGPEQAGGARETAAAQPKSGQAPVPAFVAPPTPPPAPRAPAAASPELSAAAAPEPRWYVRPPTGGQYGPASESVFRGWIQDARVAPDAYVWREGWADWRLAREVLPADVWEKIAQASSSAAAAEAKSSATGDLRQTVRLPKNVRSEPEGFPSTEASSSGRASIGPIAIGPNANPAKSDAAKSDAAKSYRPTTVDDGEQAARRTKRESVSSPIVVTDAPAGKVNGANPTIAIDATAPLVAQRYQHRKAAKTAFWISLVLTCGCLALLAALIYVLR